MTNPLPKVKQGTKPPSLYTSAVALLLLEKTEIFGHESLVSVYYKEDNYEILIGLGFISTVQENGLIQVIVQSNVDDRYNDTWKLITSNNTNALERILVKPTIPKSILK